MSDQNIERLRAELREPLDLRQIRQPEPWTEIKDIRVRLFLGSDPDWKLTWTEFGSRKECSGNIWKNRSGSTEVNRIREYLEAEMLCNPEPGSNKTWIVTNNLCKLPRPRGLIGSDLSALWQVIWIRSYKLSYSTDNKYYDSPAQCFVIYNNQRLSEATPRASKTTYKDYDVKVLKHDINDFITYCQIMNSQSLQSQA